MAVKPVVVNVPVWSQFSPSLLIRTVVTSLLIATNFCALNPPNATSTHVADVPMLAAVHVIPSSLYAAVVLGAVPATATNLLTLPTVDPSSNSPAVIADQLAALGIKLALVVHNTPSSEVAPTVDP